MTSCADEQALLLRGTDCTCGESSKGYEEIKMLFIYKMRGILTTVSKRHMSSSLLGWADVGSLRFQLKTGEKRFRFNAHINRASSARGGEIYGGDPQ